MKRGMSGFETIIIVILTILFIVVGFTISGWLNPGARAEDVMNRTKDLEEEVIASGVTCKGELSGFQHYMARADGTYGGVWIWPAHVSDEINVTCRVPGTAGGLCIFDSFSRGQELTAQGQYDHKRGWFSFSLVSPYSRREFNYTCVWDYDTYREIGIDKISWKKDMREDYDNFRQVGIVPAGENATIRSKFSILSRKVSTWCDPGTVFNVRSECGKPNKGIYCDPWAVSRRFWNWTLTAGGYYCCPPPGEVKDASGNLVVDPEGGTLEEDWGWDWELGICCVNQSCDNYYNCEDFGGKWLYGECWFAGTDDCDNVCSNEPDTPMVCKPPDYWNRIPQTCELHEIMGLDCSGGCTDSTNKRAPHETAGNRCVDQANLTMSTGWCAEPAAGFTRICACELP